MSDKRAQLNIRLRPEAKKKMKAYALEKEMDLISFVQAALQEACDRLGIKTKVI